MKKTLWTIATIWMLTGCTNEPMGWPPEICDGVDNDGNGLVDEICDAGTDSDAPAPEICGNGWDDDIDGFVDEEDCIGGTDAATDSDTAADTTTDTGTDDAATEPDTTCDTATDTATDTTTDTVPDTTPDTAVDTATDDSPHGGEIPGPPAPIGTIYAEFRDWVSNPGDAVESRIYGDMLSGTFATLPGRPSALCAFGSWNSWSTTTGRICKTWSETATPGSLWYTRGGDTGWFFQLGSATYELDLSKFDFVSTEPCYRAAASDGGTTRLALRCPALPEMDVCTDGADNDHDGVTDDDDPDCDTFWEPPATPDQISRLSGVAIGSCVNFSGTFYLDSRDGYGLVRPLNPGEYIDRVTAYHDATTGCLDSACFSLDYPGDGEPMGFTLCGFTQVKPAVITSWGAILKMDVTQLVLAGDLCRTASNTALTAWGLGSCGGATPPISGTEICDGSDNDSDGLTDETFTCVRYSTRTCTSSCSTTGTQTCDTSCSWGTCVPPGESCNSADDDCDGTVDEGCSSSTTSGTYSITGRTMSGYREIEIRGTLEAHHAAAFSDNPFALEGTEEIGALCVTYGSEDWDDQVWDPDTYHTDPAFPVCTSYANDSSSYFIRIPDWNDEFLVFAIGTRGTPRHRAWINLYDSGWTFTGVTRTSTGILSF
ncbi:MAG: MopE-related protein [Patescibacteria group bacterium]|nr:MopE-related protein [Patescibacteria group bacterium]